MFVTCLFVCRYHYHDMMSLKVTVWSQCGYIDVLLAGLLLMSRHAAQFQEYLAKDYDVRNC